MFCVPVAPTNRTGPLMETVLCPVAVVTAFAVVLPEIEPFTTNSPAASKTKITGLISVPLASRCTKLLTVILPPALILSLVLRRAATLLLMDVKIKSLPPRFQSALILKVPPLASPIVFEKEPDVVTLDIPAIVPAGTDEIVFRLSVRLNAAKVASDLFVEKGLGPYV